jgi:hypothetical protein
MASFLSVVQHVVTDCVLFMWPSLLNGHGESTGIDDFFNNFFSRRRCQMARFLHAAGAASGFLFQATAITPPSVVMAVVNL